MQPLARAGEYLPLSACGSSNVWRYSSEYAALHGSRAAASWQIPVRTIEVKRDAFHNVSGRYGLVLVSAGSPSVIDEKQCHKGADTAQAFRLPHNDMILQWAISDCISDLLNRIKPGRWLSDLSMSFWTA